MYNGERKTPTTQQQDEKEEEKDSMQQEKWKIEDEKNFRLPWKNARLGCIHNENLKHVELGKQTDVW